MSYCVSHYQSHNVSLTIDVFLFFAVKLTVYFVMSYCFFRYPCLNLSLSNYDYCIRHRLWEIQQYNYILLLLLLKNFLGNYDHRYIQTFLLIYT